METSPLIGFRSLVEREIVRFTSVFLQTIFPPLISSLLYLSIFGYTIGARIPTIHGIPYLHFLIPGLVMMYVIEAAYQNTSSSLFISRWAGHIQEILVSPLSYLEMVLAILIGGLVRSLVIAGGVPSIAFIYRDSNHPSGDCARDGSFCVPYFFLCGCDRRPRGRAV